ncbi:MAG TPA: GNAT family N-acetyltransferase [Gemmatimonadales bacterium]|jgi:RimJ/RimL family protein N-acetyltransferase|nr:GNAT family N-acetyltransferase [Gemmatimonadales bacterium]
MQILTTERLAVRHLEARDADFLVALLNEPSFLRFIGDRGVRTPVDALRWLADGPLTSYAAHGFGLSMVERRDTDESIGICGLLKRDTLDDVDLGFAYRPAFWKHGYAIEAGRAMLGYAQRDKALQRVVAITSLDNDASIRVLTRLGFQFERLVRLTEGAEELRLFGVDLAATSPSADSP